MSPRVRLEVVAHLAAGRPMRGRRREPHTRQRVVPRGAVEPQRVPPVTPVVPEAGVGVEDREGAAQLLQVVAGREPGLAAADDRGVEVLDCVLAAHRCSPWPGSEATNRPAGRHHDRSERASCRRIGESTQSPRGAHGYRGSDDVVLVGERRRRRARGHVELREDVADVPVDGPLADPEGLRDLAVRAAAGDEAEDLGLAFAEAARDRRRRAGDRVDPPYVGRRTEPLECVTGGGELQGRRLTVAERAAGEADPDACTRELVRGVHRLPQAPGPAEARQRGARVSSRQLRRPARPAPRWRRAGACR